MHKFSITNNRIKQLENLYQIVHTNVSENRTLPIKSTNNLDKRYDDKILNAENDDARVSRDLSGEPKDDLDMEDETANSIEDDERGNANNVVMTNGRNNQDDTEVISAYPKRYELSDSVPVSGSKTVPVPNALELWEEHMRRKADASLGRHHDPNQVSYNELFYSKRITQYVYFVYKTLIILIMLVK